MLADVRLQRIDLLAQVVDDLRILRATHEHLERMLEYIRQQPCWVANLDNMIECVSGRVSARFETNEHTTTYSRDAQLELLDERRQLQHNVVDGNVRRRTHEHSLAAATKLLPASGL